MWRTMVLIEMLNENQKKAVLTSSQYVRIIAGAGSGKTRVLTMRIAHLIEQCHVWPNKILAITFTNKAANEMKERIRQMLPEQGNAVFISTIHSLCVRILREDIPAMGHARNFTVMDADDQRSILKEAYKEFGLDKQTYTFGSMLDYIANNKAAEISPGAGLCVRRRSARGKRQGEGLRILRQPSAGDLRAGLRRSASVYRADVPPVCGNSGQVGAAFPLYPTSTSSRISTRSSTI